ncbi:hypothetical protein O181_040008 [Austropuccinia psidii MF-1]|uniref:Tet-like 2OG-Fe(II) oxygenase domain-containing protein n=1 Tax=Austropuccinia psidii MF-1 TaxID=1389203 RepID=A0A9Q3DGD1_9BASI|nr:hypothetical protein [Austropuccinia psidii MF-1]
MEIFSSTGLLISLVEFRPFTAISEVEVNQWEELSQFLFCERKFTNLIATNGELLGGFMFTIGWRKCSTKNEQFGLYGRLGKIESTKDEWQNQGANLSSVGCILAFAVTPYAGAAFWQCQQFLIPFQAPNASHAKSLCLYRFPTIQIIPYAAEAS